MADESSQSLRVSEDELIRRVLEGRSDLFEALIEPYVPQVYSMALRMTKNVADAEDVLQEASLTAFRKLDTFKRESSFGTWLYKIALNQTYMAFRKKKHAGEETLDDYMPRFDAHGVLRDQVRPFRGDPEDETIRNQMSGVIAEAIEALPGDFRAVLIARDIDELSTKETADALELSEAAVKSRLHRARLALRKKLEAQYGRSGTIRKWLDILSSMGKS